MQIPIREELRGEALSRERARVLRGLADDVERAGRFDGLQLELPSGRPPRDRAVAAVIASILVAALLAAVGMKALRDEVVRDLPGVRLADPTPELRAYHHLEGITAGPIIVSVGPEARSLGIGPLTEGDYFYKVAGERVTTCLELKRALVNEGEIRDGRNRRVSISSPASTFSREADLDLAALRAIPRPILRWVPERAFVITTASVPALLLVLIYAVASGHARRRRLLLATVVALGAIAFASELVMLDVLRSWGASF